MSTPRFASFRIAFGAPPGRSSRPSKNNGLLADMECDFARLAAPMASAMFVVALSIPAAAQNFTRVTDAANPVVTDLAQSGGGCWIDIDDDGDLDLFVANGNLDSQDNAFYLNTGGGSFVKVTTGSLVTDGGTSIGGTWGDYDNDGLGELFVTNRESFGNFLYQSEGDTTFTGITGIPPVTDTANSNSSSWVDVDLDGDLDLYVINFGAPDYFYRNEGSPGYSLVPMNTIPPVAGNAPTIPGAWGDFDNDRDPDLFIGIAGSANDVLWRNDGGFAFTAIGFTDGRATLGASWGDYDNDGNLDLVSTSFLNQRSILYRNAGAPTFALVPQTTSPVSNTLANAVGSAWGDYDNDGDLDLFIGANAQNNLLFENQGPPSYEFVRIVTGTPVSDGGSTFGCVWGDYDADGHLDLFAANQNNEVNFLYHNDATEGHWLTVRCTGTVSNRSAIGARVHVRATIDGSPVWQMRDVQAQTGYNSQNLDLHFGLGDASVVDSMRIEWPAGGTDVLTNVPADQLLRVVELSPADVDQGDLDPAGDTIQLAQSGWGAELAVRFSLPISGWVQLRLFDLSGREVQELANSHLGAGVHDVRIAADALPSGVFACRLHFATGEGEITRSSKVVSLR